MFRVAFFVEDNKLGVIKRVLQQNGVKDVEDQPVVNAEKAANGKLRQQTSGSLVDRVWNSLLAVRPKLKRASSKVLKSAIVAQGGSAGSIYHVTSILTQQKRLRRLSKGEFALNRKAA